MGAQGIFSGAGGQAIAQELMQREDRGQSDLMGNLMKMVPSLLEAKAKGSAYEAAAAKAKAETAEIVQKTKAADLGYEALLKLDPTTAELARAGWLKEGSLNDQLNIQAAIQGGKEAFGYGPDTDMNDPDVRMMTGALKATGGDAIKAVELIKKNEELQDNIALEKEGPKALELLDRVQAAVNDPRVRETYKTASPGITDDQINSQIVLNALQNPEVQSSAPYTTAILLRNYSRNGLAGVNQFIMKGHEKMVADQLQANLQQTQADVVLKGAQATKETAEAGWYGQGGLKEQEIKAKINKLNRPPASGGAKGQVTAKDIYKRANQLNDQADALDAKAALIPGYTPSEKATKKTLAQQASQKRDEAAGLTGQSRPAKKGYQINPKLQKLLLD